ncbi:uncharacterized protein V6R79_021038 [Siganus canaliculatus]
MTGEHAPAWDSGNSTVWEEYTDITFLVANSLILLVTSVVGIAANTFVILAVYHQKSLQTWNNALVVNLAVIDSLRCAVDCPILLTIVVTAHQRQQVDELICDAQMASFSFTCCIQLLTLACISAERHQAIAQPFKITQRRRRIMVLIPVTWILAVLVAVSSLTFIKDSPVHVKCKGLHGVISSSYDTFGLYMLFPLWAACFGVIIGFYTRIFILVRSHNRKIFDKGTNLTKKEKAEDEQTKAEPTTAGDGHEKSEQKGILHQSVAQMELVTPPAEANSSKKDSPAALLTSAQAPSCASENKSEFRNTLEITELETEQPGPPAVQVLRQAEEKALKTEQPNPLAKSAEAKPANGDAAAGVKSLTKPQKASCNFNTEEQSKERVKIDKAPSEMKESNPHVPSSARFENAASTSVLLTEVKQAENNKGREMQPVAAADQVPSLPPGSNHVPETQAPKPNVEVEGAVCMMPSKANKERVSKKKESKMAKRAGYIIISFLLFWLPLITTVLVNFVVHNNKKMQTYLITDLEVLSVSVACITSLSDPIIYAAVNPQFRTEFQRIKSRVESVFQKK